VELIKKKIDLLCLKIVGWRGGGISKKINDGVVFLHVFSLCGNTILL
jgi:hypothetical protein